MDDKATDSEELAKRVVARLQERLELSDLAGQIKKQLALAGVLVTDAGGQGPRDEKETDCSDAKVTHKCGAADKGSYACPSQGGKPFECKGPGVFQCGKFTCKKDYSCPPRLYDHACSSDFTCKQFDCAGSHMFVCFTDHECVGMFKCKHCNPKKCEVPHKKYEWNDDGVGGIDKIPGDFRCGDTGIGIDEFYCADKFECTVADQFECAVTTWFTCGKEAGDTFHCGGAFGGRFECDGSYEPCKPPVDFTCTRAAPPYNP